MYISIITPVYNASKYIEETIKSVLKQTHHDWELILVNDCSTDDSLEIIKKYEQCDKRIRVIELQHNSGVAHARNTGIESSKYEYLAFLDSDDLWTPDKLKIQVEYIEKTGNKFTFTGCCLINDEGLSLEKIRHVPSEVTYKQLLKGNIIPCSSVVIAKNIIGSIRQKKIGHEDYAFWLTILKSGYRAYGIDEPFLIYRKRSTSISSNKLKALSWTWGIFKNEMKICLPLRIHYFIWFCFNTIKKYTKRK